MRRLFHDVGRRGAFGLARTRYGQRVLRGLLSDAPSVQLIVNTPSDRVARQSTFDGLPTRVECFEDCAASLSSNLLNHGVSRLMLEEAVYVHRLVRTLDNPNAVELGRYQGGTTFLLAAAGARVLSIDNDPAVARFDESLRNALERHGFLDRVTLRIADSQTFPAEPASHDLALVDADHSYDGVNADVEHWLPTLTQGGHLLLHDAVRPDPPTPWRDPLKVDGVLRLYRELRENPRLSPIGTVGTLAHFAVETTN